MNVDSYIAARRADWERLAEATARGQRGLARQGGAGIDDAIRLYLRATADLAEVRVRYHDPQLETYLNGIVVRAHGVIYGARARSLRAGLAVFWSRYREAVRRTRAHIGVAAAVFVACAAAVLVWVVRSREARAGLVPGFAEAAVRDSGGGAFGAAPRGALSTFILTNNVQVAFLAFAFGISFGIGTAYLVVTNAVLIGALGGAYTAAGHAGDFWSLVLPHGFLEITAIAFAAGAGLRMGWSLIAPGDLSRGEALAIAARDAVMVVVGVIPAFVLAALIEVFLTPTALPGEVKIGIGAAVAACYLVLVLALPTTADRTP